MPLKWIQTWPHIILQFFPGDKNPIVWFFLTQSVYVFTITWDVWLTNIPWGMLPMFSIDTDYRGVVVTLTVVFHYLLTILWEMSANQMLHQECYQCCCFLVISYPGSEWIRLWLGTDSADYHSSSCVEIQIDQYYYHCFVLLMLLRKSLPDFIQCPQKESYHLFVHVI